MTVGPLTAAGVALLLGCAVLLVTSPAPWSRPSQSQAARPSRTQAVRWAARWGRGRSGRPLVAGGAEPDVALVVDLVAAVLTTGAPPHTALEVVGRAVGGEAGGDVGAAMLRVAARTRLGAVGDRAWDGDADLLELLRRPLDLARDTGAPAAALLRQAAADLRGQRHRRAQAAAGRLGVRLVLPLGLCSLPAFVAWAVVPVVLSLAEGLLGS
ncbi:type II secretion system F family protein [Thalassiella azotivora]